jgi:hypothetical protein
MRLSSCFVLPTLCLFLCIGLVGSACKSGPKTIKLPTEGKAGRVVELVGQVWASRSGEDKLALSEGHDIYVDHTVTTEKGASVAIFLNHNGAVHNIGADAVVEVEGSLAWTATVKVASSFDPTDKHEGSGSAGVNSEQPAGETAPVPTLYARRANQSQAWPVVPSGTNKSLPGSPPEKEDPAQEQPEEEVPEETKPEKKKVEEEKPDAKATGGGGSGEADAGTSGGEIGARGGETTPKGDTNTPPLERTRQNIVLLLARACQETHGGSGAFELMVHFKGSKVISIQTKGAPELRETLSCLEEKVRGVGKPPAEATWTFSLKLSKL